MSDIRLTYSGQIGDLDLTTHALRLVSGEGAIEQQLSIRLRYLKGSWFLDANQGVPYFQSILVKAPDLAVIRSIFRKAIQSTPRIASVDSLHASLDTATRKLSLTFSATMDTGAQLIFSPFIIGI